MFQERNNRVGCGNYSNMLCRLISNLGFFHVERDLFFEFLMFSSMLLSFQKISFRLKLLKIESEVFH